MFYSNFDKSETPTMQFCLCLASILNEEAGYTTEGNWPNFRDLLALGNQPNNDLHLFIPHDRTATLKKK